MDTLITYAIGGIISLFFLVIYLKSLKKRERLAKEAAEKGKLFSHGPTAQHPHIDNNYCIGCATCTSAFPVMPWESEMSVLLEGTGTPFTFPNVPSLKVKLGDVRVPEANR